MSTGVIIAIVIAVLVVLVVAAVLVALPWQRSRHLRQKFGTEYERALEEHRDRRAAERELAQREKRHARFNLRPLPEAKRAEYTDGWTRIQERFVDSPAEAVRSADTLMGRLMSEQGYPDGEYEQRLADLSVEHAATLDHYRSAHEISERSEQGEASTEDLRNAMVHYRTLFADLLGTDPHGTDGQAVSDAPGPESGQTTVPRQHTGEESRRDQPNPY